MAEICTITTWLSIETVKYSVEEISEMLGIHPDVSHKIGEPKGRTGKLWEVNAWRLEARQEVPWNIHYEAIQSVVDSLIRRVDTVTEKFNKLSSECHNQLLIGTISIDVPGLHLSGDLLRRIANLGVDIEIDIICPDNEET
jgi:hypothetical protein